MVLRSDDHVTYLARTNHRNAGRLFGIRQADRRSHMYIVGKTGTGKSSLLRVMAAQDVLAGQGVAFFDPHGDSVKALESLVPPGRRSDLIYLDVPDPNLNWHFNPFADVAPMDRGLAAAGLVDVFRKIWPDDWGPRLEHLLRNVAYTLLEAPGSTLGDVPALLTDRDFRDALVAHVTNEVVRDFWFEEFARYSPGFRSVVVAPLQNKVGALLTDPVLHRILVGPGKTLDLRQIMDEGRLLLVNLDKGRIGEGPATALGSFLISHFALAALSRSDQRETDRRDFWIYLDEFQTFTTQSLANMLAELRKYRVGLVLANQHLSQLDPVIRDAVFGNAGSVVSFRVGADDAAYLAREFAPVFAPADFIGLPGHAVYLRLLIDGEPSRPFSANPLGSLTEVPGYPQVGGSGP